jgi:hypothetical protein
MKPTENGSDGTADVSIHRATFVQKSKHVRIVGILAQAENLRIDAYGFQVMMKPHHAESGTALGK